MAKKKTTKETGNSLMRVVFDSVFVPENIEKIDTRLRIIKWGKDNDYAQFLVSLAQKNPIHGGIINKKITFISASGINSKDESILENYEGEYDLQEVQKNIVQDNEYFNGFAVVFRLGEDGKYYAENIDFEKIRCTEDNIFFAYNDNWSDNKSKAIYYQNIEFRDETDFVDDDGKDLFQPDFVEEDCFIMYVKTQAKQSILSRKFSTNYYPVPNYASAIVDIMALNNMSQFALSETENNFSSGLHIDFQNGIPETADEADKLRAKYGSMLKDKDKQGGAFMTFSDGSENGVKITTLNGNNLDTRYNQAKTITRENIMIAHQVISETLFGISQSGIFGSKEELEMAFVLFKDNYVKERQDAICSALEWGFSELNGWDGELFYNDFKLNIDGSESENETLNKLNQLDDSVKAKILENMTPNQLLALVELPSIEGGDVLRDKAPIAFKMSNDADDLDARVIAEFSKVGRSREMFKFVEKKSNFDSDLTARQASILQMMQAGESFDAIKEALEISTKQLSSDIIGLGALGYLDGFELTEKGKTEPSQVVEVETVYSYAVKPNVPPAKNGSRPFCTAMMSANKVYTREEIEGIGIAVGLEDIWRFRGGWYRNPKSGVNTPSCRHEWEQHSVIKIK